MTDAESIPQTAGDAVHSEPPDPAEFYRTGGTMSGDAASYVPRRDDADLLKALSAGEFCYVLTSRQMGKSSLMVRTAARLRQQGAAVVLIDLTGIGSGLTEEQWYASLRNKIGQQLHLEGELRAYAQEKAAIAPLQRWVGAVVDVVLRHVRSNLVIFLDEIDFAKSLKFSTDEFFSAIRALFNQRTMDPELGRLTFCLLGVTSPTDLIRSKGTTPFNIGRRIGLADFTHEEAQRLALGLGRDRATAGKVLQRVLYWTGGHPYLTQRLCQAAAENHANGPGAVDELCHDMFLSTRARASDDSFRFTAEQLPQDDKERGGILTAYSKIQRGSRVPDDPADRLASILLLAGLVRSVGGRLAVRNRIYASVFDKRWIKLNMPDQEARRQREAYIHGFLKAGLISAVIVAVISGLAATAVMQRREAVKQQGLTAAALQRVEEQRKLALELKAEADIGKRRAEQAEKQAVTEGAEAERRRKEAEEAKSKAATSLAKLEEQKKVTEQLGTAADNSSHIAALHLADALVARGDALAASGRWGEAKASYHVAIAAYSRAGVSSEEADLGLMSAYVHSPLPLWALPAQESSVTCAAVSPDGRFALSGSAGGSITLWDLLTGNEKFAFEGHKGPVLMVAFSPDGGIAISAGADGTVRTWDAVKGHSAGTLALYNAAAGSPVAGLTPLSFDLLSAKDGQRIASCDAEGLKIWDLKSGSLIRKIASAGGGRIRAAPDGSSVVMLRPHSPPQLIGLSSESSLPIGPVSEAYDATYSPDGRTLFTAGTDKTVRQWDVSSGSLVRILPSGADSALRTVAVSPDGKRLLAGGDDRTVRVWDLDSGAEVLDLTGHEAAVLACAVSPDGRVAVSGAADKSVIAWPLASEADSPLIRGAGGRFAAVSDDRRMVTFDSLLDAPPGPSGTRVIAIFDIETGLPLFHGEATTTAQADHRVMVARADDHTSIGTFVVAPVLPVQEQRALVTPLVGYSGDAVDAAFSPDKSMVATGGSDGTVRLWNVKEARESRRLTRQHACFSGDSSGNDVQSVSFSPDSSLLFASYASDFGPETEIWDLGRAARLRDWKTKLGTARDKLSGAPHDPKAFRDLAGWHEFRGTWNLAADLLSGAGPGGNYDDSIRLLRCSWLAGIGGVRSPATQPMLPGKDLGSSYARLVSDLLRIESLIPARFGIGSGKDGERRWLRVRARTWLETLDGVPMAEFQLSTPISVNGKPGALFDRVPIHCPEPEAMPTQVFVSDDVTASACRSKPGGRWTATGPITPGGPPATRPIVVAIKSTAAATPDSHDEASVAELLKAAADDDLHGDYVAAASKYRKAAGICDASAVAAVDLAKSARGLLNEGNPAGALKFINDANPRIRSAQRVAALVAEIKDLQAKAPAYLQKGLDAKNRNAKEAFSNFFMSACGGSAEAMLQLGDMYRDGQGVEANDNLAKAWWHRAADAGNAVANERLRPSDRLPPVAFPNGHSG